MGGERKTCPSPKLPKRGLQPDGQILKGWLIEGNGYETRQSSLLYMLLFCLLFRSCLLFTEELTNRNVLVT